MIRTGIAACTALCLAASAPAAASGLQVDPVMVTIAGRASTIRLLNQGDTPMRAQVRVYRWTQPAGDDLLAPADTLVASPPFADIPPEAVQVVRLAQLAAPADADETCETAYRVLVDDLPQADGGNRGLRFRMRYSVPVFVLAPGCDHARPKLAAAIEADGTAPRLVMVNSGLTHAQIARTVFVLPGGERIEVSAGLIGYVLPGAARSFVLPGAPTLFAQGGQLEITVNGSQVTMPVGSAALAR